jgi:hypothetical protein
LIEETIRAKIVFHERYWRDISEDGIPCRDLTDTASKGFYPRTSSSQSSEPAYGRGAPQTHSHILTIKAALKYVWLTGKTANDTTDLLPNVKEGCTPLFHFQT